MNVLPSIIFDQYVIRFCKENPVPALQRDVRTEIFGKQIAADGLFTFVQWAGCIQCTGIQGTDEGILVWQSIDCLLSRGMGDNTNESRLFLSRPVLTLSLLYSVRCMTVTHLRAMSL